jgi:hypothetical protein
MAAGDGRAKPRMPIAEARRLSPNLIFGKLYLSYGYGYGYASAGLVFPEFVPQTLSPKAESPPESKRTCRFRAAAKAKAPPARIETISQGETLRSSRNGSSDGEQRSIPRTLCGRKGCGEEKHARAKRRRRRRWVVVCCAKGGRNRRWVMETLENRQTNEGGSRELSEGENPRKTLEKP